MSRKQKRGTRIQALHWKPPPLGWFKVNFDAAYMEGIIHPAVIIRDDNEVFFINAWVSEIDCDGPFAAEAAAAEMAFKMGESLQS